MAAVKIYTKLQCLGKTCAGVELEFAVIIMPVYCCINIVLMYVGNNKRMRFAAG